MGNTAVGSHFRRQAITSRDGDSAVPLPDDVWREMIRWLRLVDLLRFALVSRRMCRLVGSPKQWRLRFDRHAGTIYTTLVERRREELTIGGFTWYRMEHPSRICCLRMRLSYVALPEQSKQARAAVLAAFGLAASGLGRSCVMRTRGEHSFTVMYTKSYACGDVTPWRRWTIIWTACVLQQLDEFEACTERVRRAVAKEVTRTQETAALVEINNGQRVSSARTPPTG